MGKIRKLVVTDEKFLGRKCETQHSDYSRGASRCRGENVVLRLRETAGVRTGALEEKPRCAVQTSRRRRVQRCE